MQSVIFIQLLRDIAVVCCISKTYISEWLNSRKHKRFRSSAWFGFMVSRGSESDRERVSKRHPLLYCHFLQTYNFLGQCTLAMKCIKVSPEVNRPLKSNLQRYEMLLLLVCFCFSVNFSTLLGRCFEINGQLAWQLSKMVLAPTYLKVSQQPGFWNRPYLLGSIFFPPSSYQKYAAQFKRLPTVKIISLLLQN